MQKTEKAALISVLTSAVLAAGMIVTSVITGSVSVLAQGIHTAVDSVASIAVLIGLRLSGRHTEQFPFGLYKLENLIATVIGVLILLGAYELARDAVRGLRGGGSNLDKPALILIVMPVAIVVTGFMAWYMGKVAKQENSPSLRASSRDALADMASSFAVLIAAALEMGGVKYADGVAALVVVLFLIWSGLRVTLDGLKVLLDASVERDVLDKVRQLAEQDLRIKKVVKVEGRNSGSYRFLSVSIVPRTRDLEEAHHLSHDLEREIISNVANVDRARIELEVEKKDALLFAAPVEEDGTSLASHFGKAPFFALFEVGAKDGDVIKREVLANPFFHLEEQKGIRVTEFLAREGVDMLITKQAMEHKGAFYALQAQGIDVINHPELTTLSEAENMAREYTSSMAER